MVEVAIVELEPLDDAELEVGADDGVVDELPLDVDDTEDDPDDVGETVEEDDATDELVDEADEDTDELVADTDNEELVCVDETVGFAIDDTEDEVELVLAELDEVEL